MQWRRSEINILSKVRRHRESLIITILLSVATCSCKQNQGGFLNRVGEGSDKVVDKLCVWNPEGTPLLNTKSKYSKKIMNLPHKTLLDVFEVGDTGMKSFTRFQYGFVKVSGKEGYVDIEDLEWNCDDFGNLNADLMELDGSLLYGVWKQSTTDRLYLEFSDNFLFGGKLTGGCDSGGCHDYVISGEWKINRNLLYFRPLEFIPKYPANVKIYFLSKKKVLYPVDTDHAFRYDYNDSEYLSGLKKIK